MKLELTLDEAIRLEQAARLMGTWEGDGDLSEIARVARSAHQKLRGALERSGCRADADNNWTLPRKAR